MSVNSESRSTCDGKTYRIAIKQDNDRESKGIVSNGFIEKCKEDDTALVSLLASTFTLIEDAKHHLFIVGRIGITVLSLLIQKLHQQRKSYSATLIHCAPTESYAAFAKQMRIIF
ncbi:unnamed protein product [Rotaria sp. Silwood1]|nr:unnamed protein product [Rotaria sp. Silwood1]